MAEYKIQVPASLQVRRVSRVSKKAKRKQRETTPLSVKDAIFLQAKSYTLYRIGMSSPTPHQFSQFLRVSLDTRVFDSFPQ